MELLRIKGQSLENAHLKCILSGMKADIERLDIECPKVTPNLLDAIVLKRIKERIIVCGDKRQLEKFDAFCEKLYSETKSYGHPQFVFADLMGPLPASVAQKLRERKPSQHANCPFVFRHWRSPRSALYVWPSLDVPVDITERVLTFL